MQQANTLQNMLVYALQVIGHLRGLRQILEDILNPNPKISQAARRRLSNA
jgi:hypothetical protein